jgi:hypothetical protein
MLSLGSETFEEEEDDIISRELWMSDNADYKIEGDEVTFWVETIANDRLYTSGNLRLKLLASEEPYFENESYDYVLSTYEIGKLNASGLLSNLNVTAKLETIPPGSYFITIALIEDYWVVDYVSSGYEIFEEEDVTTPDDGDDVTSPDDDVVVVPDDTTPEDVVSLDDTSSGSGGGGGGCFISSCTF